MTQLDVTFANLYFAAADTAGNPAAVPLAWRRRWWSGAPSRDRTGPVRGSRA